MNEFSSQSRDPSMKILPRDKINREGTIEEKHLFPLTERRCGSPCHNKRFTSAFSFKEYGNFNEAENCGLTFFWRFWGIALFKPVLHKTVKFKYFEVMLWLAFLSVGRRITPCKSSNRVLFYLFYFCSSITGVNKKKTNKK